jgi:hypothetical protein
MIEAYGLYPVSAGKLCGYVFTLLDSDATRTKLITLVRKVIAFLGRFLRALFGTPGALLALS